MEGMVVNMGKKLIAALSLALMLCVALAGALPMGANLAARAEANASTLSVDRSKLTLNVGETQTVLLTWTSTTGQLYYSWDNSAVIKFEKSGQWTGQTTKLFVTGLAAGKAKITITNSLNTDKATINVTVKGDDVQQDMRDLLGITVKNANKRLEDKLRAVSGAYSNGYFSARTNALGRLNDINITAGDGKYTLFAVYPGLSFKKAAAQLKKLGWKQVKKQSDTYFYLNDDYLCRAVSLVKKGANVAAVRYFVP